MPHFGDERSTADSKMTEADGRNLDERTTTALRSVFGDSIAVSSITPIDHGRGVFSHVMQAQVDRSPGSVAVKLLRSDANGAAALTSGAVAREILAYEHLLPVTKGVSVPEFFGISHDERNTPTIILQDLSGMRFADQVTGLTDGDIRAITQELITLHNEWAVSEQLDTIGIRRSTPSLLPADALARGAAMLDTAWANISAERRSALQALAANREAAVHAFGSAGTPTLCHGDPRGDNVAFTEAGRAILFDWQQIAVQVGEADVAWLLATSTNAATRRAIEGDILASYALARGQDAATTWHRYVVGMVLPGLAVLMLAQRAVDDEHGQGLVRSSIERIADAVIDLRVTEAISQ